MKKIVGLFIILLSLGFNVTLALETWTGTINNPPVVTNDTATTDEDVAIEIYVVLNDTDIDLDVLEVVWISNFLNWTWEILTSWTWILFTPDVNFNWTWSLYYTISDWELTDTWSVVITVNSVNDEPVIQDDELETDENEEETIDPRDNDTDVDWDELVIIWKTDWLNGSVSYTETSITYTPNTDFHWNDTFTYTISDWNWWEDIWVINVTVNEEDEDEDEDENEDEDEDENEDEDEDEDENEELWNRWNWVWYWYGNLKREKYVYKWVFYKNRYKITLKNKYWKTISKLNNNKLVIIVWRIDNLIEEVNDWDYSDETKETFNTILLALRELIEENLDNTEDILDIDSLFE